MKYSQIFLDLDGVLADFTKAAAKIHKIELPSEMEEDFLYSKFAKKGHFWSKCNSHEFWANIPRYPWAKDLVRLVDRSGINFTFLTKAPMGTGAWSGKARWIESNFGAHQNKLWVVRGDKSIMAQKGYLLIDDKTSSIEGWRERGGDAFQWKELSADNTEQAKYYLEQVRRLIS